MNDEHEDRNIDQLLNDWNFEFHPDKSLHNRVKSRILDIQKQDQFSNKGQNKVLKSFSHPHYTIISVAALLLFGIFLGYWFSPSKEFTQSELALMYRSSIDPVYRLNNLDDSFKKSTISWLESELALNNKQIRKFEDLHQSYRSTFNSLYLELQSLKTNYEAFENDRKTAGIIDFIALYDLLEKQKSIRRDSIKETEALIQGTLELLDHDQQTVFDNLINTLPPTSIELPPPNV